MNNVRANQRRWLLGGSLLLIFLSIANLSKVVSDLAGFRAGTKTGSPALANDVLESADLALRSEPKTATFIYSGDFLSPFRTPSTGAVSSQNTRVPAPNRLRLLLKGILMKERPLAILEDERGETYIRGVGEKAIDQEIMKIKSNGVILRDHRGTYEIVVEEK